MTVARNVRTIRHLMLVKKKKGNCRLKHLVHFPMQVDT